MKLGTLVKTKKKGNGIVLTVGYIIILEDFTRREETKNSGVIKRGLHKEIKNFYKKIQLS